MKKVIILTPNQNALDKDELREFVEFAKNNDMQIIGVAHYPFLSAINHPKEFVNTLYNEKEVNTYLVNDEILLDSNAYNDGVLFEKLKEANIHIYHNKYETELVDLWNALDDSIRELLKNAVEYAKVKMNEHNAMVITRDRSQKDVDELIHSIEGKGLISIVEMNAYISEMKDILEEDIRKNSIDEVIIIDRELMTSELIEDLEMLSKKYEFQIYDIDRYMMRQQSIDQMMVN